MKIQFTSNAWEEFEYWIDHDPEVTERIRSLIREIKQNPFKGTGKPEALRFELQGFLIVMGFYELSNPLG